MVPHRVDSHGGALVGRHLGVYEVGAPLGAGGMGEVYRARDTRLGRDVAIKVLPQAFSADPERLGRFEEARVLASLSHPHIAAIHGVEPFDGTDALVLELVEGETLDAPDSARAEGAARDGTAARRLAGESRGRLPTRSTRPTKKASSIGISSRRTSRSRPPAS